MGLQYALFRRGPLTMAPSQLGAFAKSDPSRETPDLEYHVQPLSLEKFGDPLHPFPAFTASVCNLRPESRGTVRIRSREPTDAPSIRPRTTSRTRPIAWSRRGRSGSPGGSAGARALARFEPQEFLPGEALVSDEQLAAAAGTIGTTIFHAVGTCKMGQGFPGGGGRSAAGAGHRGAACRGRLDHADDHLGQHQCARHHDRREGGRYDQEDQA